MYYVRAVYNKLLFSLSAIGAHQDAVSQQINKAINQLIDYSATYPADGILYYSSNMVICAHSDAGFHNESKGRGRVGALILLSENDPMPKWNGPVLTLAHIIKFVMSSASEAELGAIFITAQEMLATRNTLEEMRWPHSKLPIQTENSSTEVLVSNKSVPRKIKTTDPLFHWLRRWESQGQFRYYLARGGLNWGY